MAFIHIPKGWQLPEGEVTPEDVYLNRPAVYAGR